MRSLGSCETWLSWVSSRSWLASGPRHPCETLFASWALVSVGASGAHCPFSSRLAHGARQTSQAWLTCEASRSFLALVTFGSWWSHRSFVTFDTRESHFTSEPLETYRAWGTLWARRTTGTFGTHRTWDTR